MASGFIASSILVSSIFLFAPEAHAQAGGGCAALIAAKATGVAQGIAGGEAANAGAAVTHPGIPTYDAGNLVTQVALSQGQTVQDTTKCILDSLAWTVAKMTVQSITRSTVNWINSGFQGSPAFVTDLQSNLGTLADTVADNFFAQLNRVTTDVTGFNLKSPFQDQITQQLRANYYKATGSLLGLNQYDLNGYSKDPQAFLNGNFRQGGINAFFSAGQNPANNPFGAYMIASNALFNQIDVSAQQLRDEVIAGKGFLSFRKNCTTSNPDRVVQGASTGGSTVALAKKDSTIGCPINTPGSVIESQLENSLGSGVRQLELADSINEIVGALFGQLVNQVLGSNGLSGASQPSSGGGSSYIQQATSVSISSQNGSLSTGLLQTISNDLSSFASYRDHWQEILDAANGAQQACGVRSDITDVMTKGRAGVAKGTAAIQQETAIQTALQSALTSTAADASTQLTTAVTQYQSFLGGSATPTYDDEAYATAQSANTNGTPDSAQSLYSQMVTARNTCTRGGSL